MFAVFDSDGVIRGSGNKQAGLIAQAVVDHGGDESDYSITELTEAEIVALITARDRAAKSPIQRCYESREAGYGSWQEQLDEIFHDVDAWKARIQAVKDANPKPE